MAFVQNFPFFCILLTLICAVVTSVLKGAAARRMTLFVILAVTVMTACVMGYTLATGESYVYLMGHFPAPWGNEIRAGVLETVTMLLFCFVMLFSFVGGLSRSVREIESSKYNIYCILVDLTLLSLLALVYTNDLFTAYVFIEINTIAAAGLVMIRQNGASLVAGVRYLIMNLLGSSLFLIGIVLLYTVTGHLLMANLQESVAALAATGQYRVPLVVTVALMSVGLAMKSALFPFDKWLPGAYSNSTPTGSAVLSSLVSKGYIFLLVKVYVRVIGFDVIVSLGICDVLFVCGAVGMVMGSLSAMRAKTTRMMVAYSSVAQIGYIFMAIGMGTEAGLVCALWHMLAHAATKSMLFIATSTLDEASGGTHLRRDLRGGFYRCPLPALAFTLGAVNLVGVPLCSVFITKVMMAEAAIGVGGRHMIVALVVLAISTVLNASYFLGTAVQLFIPQRGEQAAGTRFGSLTAISLIGFIALNLLLGLAPGGILAALTSGLAQFA
ncbi:MAG: proton-conducting transporter membrane subunit [Clostridia bacterium]|nr:proton-conducting transporter membrane subunit [Clostridia bacterium]